MKSTALLLRCVRTQPFTQTSFPKSELFSTSTIFILFTFLPFSLFYLFTFLPLLIGTHTQAVNLLLGEVTPVATTQVLLGQSCKLYAVEFRHLIAKALEDTAHDAVLARVDLDTHLLLVVSIRILYVICLDLAVLQRDTVSNLLQVMGGHVLVEVYVIDLLLQELRMGQFRSHVTIVRQEQHTGGVAVKTANRIDTLWASTLHEVHHRLTLLWIVTGRYVILWFVKQHVNLLLWSNRSIVELHLISVEHLGTQLGNHLAIHGHNTCLDELISLTTAAYTSIGKELVQTDGLVGIVVLLLILYTLLETVLCIGIVISGMLAIATLLVIATTRLTITTTLLITATRLTIATTLLIATLLTRLIATGLVTALLTRLVSTLLTFYLLVITGTITALLVTATRLITTTGLVTALLIIVTRTIATLAIIWIETGTITTLTLWGTALQTGPKALRTEAALLLILTTVITTLSIRAYLLMDTWTG